MAKAFQKLVNLVRAVEYRNDDGVFHVLNEE